MTHSLDGFAIELPLFEVAEILNRKPTSFVMPSFQPKPIFIDRSAAGKPPSSAPMNPLFQELHRERKPKAMVASPQKDSTVTVEKRFIGETTTHQLPPRRLKLKLLSKAADRLFDTPEKDDQPKPMAIDSKPQTTQSKSHRLHLKRKPSESTSTSETFTATTVVASNSTPQAAQPKFKLKMVSEQVAILHDSANVTPRSHSDSIVVQQQDIARTPRLADRHFESSEPDWGPKYGCICCGIPPGKNSVWCSGLQGNREFCRICADYYFNSQTQKLRDPTSRPWPPARNSFLEPILKMPINGIAHGCLYVLSLWRSTNTHLPQQTTIDATFFREPQVRCTFEIVMYRASGCSVTTPRDIVQYATTDPGTSESFKFWISNNISTDQLSLLCVYPTCMPEDTQIFARICQAKPRVFTLKSSDTQSLQKQSGYFIQNDSIPELRCRILQLTPTTQRYEYHPSRTLK